MAVPRRRQSPTRRDRRRASNVRKRAKKHLDRILAGDSHRIDPDTGMYKGRQYGKAHIENV